ncbi:MAG: hypothetical protein WBH50_00925 [Fuerstiella sp.]
MNKFTVVTTPTLFLAALMCFASCGWAAPPTVEQANRALDIAELAVHHDMPELSLQAVTRALMHGTPTVSTDKNEGQVIHSGARVNTMSPIPMLAADKLRLRIPNLIFRLSKYWEERASATAAYSALRDIVLPSQQPYEIVFYNSPAKVNALQPDRIPEVHSVAKELVKWAARANQLQELEALLAERFPTDSPEASLLLVLCALERQGAEGQDSSSLEQPIATILASATAGLKRPVAELMANVGMAVHQDRRNPQLAAALLRVSGLALAKSDTGVIREKLADAPTRAVLLAAARSQFAVRDTEQAIALLKLYLQSSAGGSSQSVDAMHSNKSDTVARELYSRQLNDAARKILGDEKADAYERRYRAISTMDGPSTTIAPQVSAGTTLRLPEIVDPQTIDAPSKIRDKIWICSLDTRTNTSKILFALKDCQNVGSPQLSADGKMLAFDATFPGEAMTSDKKIYVVSLDKLNVRTLGRGTMPSWSPEGKRMVCSRYSPEKGVWILRVDGTEAQIVDSDGWAAQWSPDGLYIAYSKATSDNRNIAVYALVEDRFFFLAPNGGSAPIRFAWNKDSQQLAFSSEHTVSVISVFGKQAAKQVLSEPNSITSEISWKPNSNTITFARKNSQASPEQLYQLDTTNSSTATLIEGQMQERRNSDASWASDGNTLIYVSKPPK